MPCDQKGKWVKPLLCLHCIHQNRDVNIISSQNGKKVDTEQVYGQKGIFDIFGNH